MEFSFYALFWHASVSAKVFLGTSKASGVSVFLRFYLSPFLLFPQFLCAFVLVRVDVDNNWSQSGSGCDSHLGSASLLRGRRSPEWLNREIRGASVFCCCLSSWYLFTDRKIASVCQNQSFWKGSDAMKGLSVWFFLHLWHCKLFFLSLS